MRHLKRFTPIFAILLAIAVQFLLADSSEHPEAKHAYYSLFLFVVLAIFVLLAAFSFFVRKINSYLEVNGTFWTGAVIFLAVLDILTAKTALLPIMFFPTYDNILAIFAEKGLLLLKCAGHSFRLLGVGVIFGILFGISMGILMGFNKTASYWLNPLTKVIGPIPATAWIPLVLTFFPSTFQASAFIVGLSVWFPVVVMTGTGIKNIPNVYFEVGRTLGAGRFFQIFKIGIPSALPSIFQGIFYGVCSSFIALMTAEMFGAKYGLGWFVNWQKSMMAFNGVYAGLITIAIFCSAILAILSKVQGNLLRWQKGILKV